MAVPIVPVSKAMVLCEDVLAGHPATQNVHLINVFSSIRPRDLLAFPYTLPQLCVFLQLSDASGEGIGRIVARSAQDGRIIFASPGHPIRFHGRTSPTWVLFRLQDCRFLEPGLYWIEFYCDDRFVSDQSLRVSGVATDD